MSYKVGLVTFAEGNFVWRRTAKRLTRSARKSGIFAKIERCKGRDLQESLSPSFLKNMKYQRGFGYWLWKPIIIGNFARKNPNLDLVIYLDAGCHLNLNEISIPKLKEYFERVLENNSILVFKSNHEERIWTKKDLLLKFPEEYSYSNQYLATVLIGRPKQILELTNEWQRLCFESEFHFLDDSTSDMPNDEFFIEHRHDQSILSLLLKKRSCIWVSEKETYSQKWEDLRNFPIWSTRLVSGADFMTTDLINNLRRKTDAVFLKIDKVLKKLL
jgi:hypothetical protein